MQKQKTHNYGVDLLKILSIFFVLMLHVLLFGDILDSASFLSLNYEFAWMIEIFAFCAVNCYGLISGYVGYGAKHKYSRIFGLYAQIVFYTLLNFFICSFVNHSYFSIDNFLYALLPWLGGHYWYFNAYCVLFFIMPILNKVVEKINGKTAAILSIVLLLILSIIPTIFQPSISLTDNGYNFVWLSVLYIIGAFCKKYEISTYIKTKYLIIIWFLSSFSIWSIKLILETTKHQAIENMDFGLSYDSPLIFLSAVALLLIFVKIKIPVKIQKPIKLGSQSSFSIYICHMTPIVMSTFVLGKLSTYANINTILFLICLFGTVIGLFLLCYFVDLFRIFMFKKIIKITKGLKRT